MKLKIATAAYDLPVHQTFESWKTHVEKWVKEGSANGAKLLVFPEYGSIELISLMSKEIQKNLQAQLNEIQKYRDDFLKAYSDLAKKYNVTIVVPSLPWKESETRFVNRAYVFNSEKMLYQEKQVMTRFENEEWFVSSGKKELTLFSVEGILCGISICYDIEFPDFSRQQALAGAKLLIAPSCTETMAGMNRVHVGARARALENQLYVIVSQTVGDVDYSEAVDKNTGMAAVYSTCDIGFPDDGIVVQGKINGAGWTYAELDFEKVEYVRTHGRVLNFLDMKRNC